MSIIIDPEKSFNYLYLKNDFDIKNEFKINDIKINQKLMANWHKLL